MTSLTPTALSSFMYEMMSSYVFCSGRCKLCSMIYVVRCTRVLLY